LRGAILHNADLTKADLTSAILDDADFSGAILIDTAVGGVDLSKVRGLATTKSEATQYCGALLELSKLTQDAYVDTSIVLQLPDDTRVKVEVAAHPGMRRASAKCDKKMVYDEAYKRLADAMAFLAATYPGATLCWDEMTTAYTGTSINKKDLQKLARSAWYQ